MKLSVPLIADSAYLAFLAERRHCLASVYFPLALQRPWDARVGHTAPSAGPDDFSVLKSGLAHLPGIKKYVLINTRFVVPELYTTPEPLIAFLDSLAALSDAQPINGIVFSDFYLLRALDRTGHDIVPMLEAVPGVNAMLDTGDKIRASLDMIAFTRFRPPSRLILDRSLNRRLGRLSRIRDRLKADAPQTQVELLANEGCIANCPFKPAHDAQIALSNTGLVKEATFRINRQVGCHDYFLTRPEKFFSSPFIRPEDLWRYQGLADAVKICGRTLGPKFLTQCIRAYENGAFDGNLLDLMDAAGFLADHYHIHNPKLGTSFLDQMSSCTNQCKTCNICHILFQNTAEKKTITFKRYRDIT